MVTLMGEAFVGTLPDSGLVLRSSPDLRRPPTSLLRGTAAPHFDQSDSSASWLSDAPAAALGMLTGLVVALARARRQRRTNFARPAAAKTVPLVAGPVVGAADAEGHETNPLFQPWAEWLEGHFQQSLGLVEELIPEEFASRESEPQRWGGRATIKTRIFRGASPDSPVRRLRILVVDNGDALQALNVAFYPAHHLGPVPMLCADLLSFNKQKRLLFGVDWSPMQPDAAYAAASIEPHLADIKEDARYAPFASQPGTKIYGEAPEFFSPHMFFSRPEDPAAMQPGAPLWQVFQQYCERYSEMLRAAGPRNSGAVFAEERQARYDRWHAERDPAIPSLKKVFGDAWVEEFIPRVLFPGVAHEYSDRPRVLEQFIPASVPPSLPVRAVSAAVQSRVSVTA